MGKALAVLIVMAFAGLFFWALRMIGHAATGALKKLPRKDEGRDDPGRGLYLYGNDFASGPGADAFQGFRDSRCPLHAKPYCAMTVFAISRPPRMFTVLVSEMSHSAIVGRCYLISCPDCIKEANRYRSFTWNRANRPQHPVWASTQLYEHLLKDHFARVQQVSVPLPRGEGPCPPEDPPGPPPLPDQLLAALKELSVLGKKTILGRKAFHVAPDLPEPLLTDSLFSANMAHVDMPPVLADHVVALTEGQTRFLLTMEGVVTFKPAIPMGSRKAFADVKSIEISADRKKLSVDSKPVPAPSEFKGDDLVAFASIMQRVLTYLVEETRKKGR